MENFLPDALVKFGLLPDRLRELNPRLVSCSISGFGRTGPLADVPGYDLMMQAGAGLMSITGEPNGQPMKVGVAITDVITGLYAAVSVLAGLYARDRDGGRQLSGAASGGMAFDLALADCTLASLVNIVQSTLVTGQRPRRWGNAHPQIVPYESFAAADGHMVLCIGADRQWQRFCSAVGRDDWAADPRFATNPARVEHRNELIPLVRSLMTSRTTAQWGELLTGIDVPHSPVLAIDEVLATPQVAARGVVVDIRDEQGRPIRLLGSPVHWHDEPARTYGAPPALGQHTAEVLSDWLGYDEAQIDRLRQSGAIAQA